MTNSPEFSSGILAPAGDYPAFEPVYTRRLAYYSDDGKRSLIQIGFGPAQPHPEHAPVQCILVSIKGGPFDGVFESQGVDGLQCLISSFQVLRVLLDPLGDRVQFAMEPGETGIPGVQPAWPLELNRRIETLASAESERWHRDDFRAWKEAHRDDFKNLRPWPDE